MVSRRFSQAISEGDGISVIVEVADGDAARAAEAQGAEAVVVRGRLDDVRRATELPILWLSGCAPAEAARAGADACLVVVEDANEDEERLARQHREAIELGLDCVVEVRNEQELELALERLDPEIFLLSVGAEDDADALRRALELLPDVPAGKLALAALLAGAAVLRAVGIQYGLPFGNLLNPDEQSIVPRAWKIVHGGGGDPHWFDYPSLVMYVNAPFQAWQDRPSFLTARIVAIAIGLLGIAAAWWLGRRSYGSGVVPAAIVAVCTIHVAYSRAAVTDVPLTLGVTVALALMITGRIELAGLATGLATGFKYPGVFLLVPLVAAAWGRWWRLAGAVAAMVLTFLATSPFLLVHGHQAW